MPLVGHGERSISGGCSRKPRTSECAEREGPGCGGGGAEPRDGGPTDTGLATCRLRRYFSLPGSNIRGRGSRQTGLVLSRAKEEGARERALHRAWVGTRGRGGGVSTMDRAGGPHDRPLPLPIAGQARCRQHVDSGGLSGARSGAQWPWRPLTALGNDGQRKQQGQREGLQGSLWLQSSRRPPTRPAEPSAPSPRDGVADDHLTLARSHSLLHPPAAAPQRPSGQRG